MRQQVNSKLILHLSLKLKFQRRPNPPIILFALPLLTSHKLPRFYSSRAALDEMQHSSLVTQRQPVTLQLIKLLVRSVCGIETRWIACSTLFKIGGGERTRRNEEGDLSGSVLRLRVGKVRNKSVGKRGWDPSPVICFGCVGVTKWHTEWK